MTRTLTATTSGLRLTSTGSFPTYATTGGTEDSQNKNYLSFGEFDGADNQDISISLHIEGYSNTWNISVSHRIKWKGDTPHVTNTATLNGENIPYDKITITL
ncbi:MAG: hypothetical protein K2M69_06635 [Muribaculaceae bacterium]|nr:hypothetical protein [Muribaculaceae bacterium]